MNPSIIRFHHFASEQSYCKLQEIFGSFDFKRDYNTIKEPLEDFEVTYYVRDEFCQYEEYKTLSFLKDFAMPGINQLCDYYFENFRKEINDKGLHTKELIDGLAKYRIDISRDMIKKIKKAKYISVKIRIPLIVQLVEFTKLIEGFLENPYPNIKRKIQFNWNRTDVQYFFHLLRENEVITWIEDADLGKIIDSTIEYRDKDEYQPIKNSRKHLNDFKNSAERSQIKTNERLKKVFMNEDFFNQ